MKRKLSLVVVALALVAMILTACGGEETYSNIAAQSNPYVTGTQSIEIRASSINYDEPTARFKQSISPSDIELGQALEGKIVTKVVFNSESSITVTLDGTAKQAGERGTITVKRSGMESKGNSSCVVNVLYPQILVENYNCSEKTAAGGVKTYRVRAKLRLSAGEFLDFSAQNVLLKDDVTGELSVSLSDGKLSVEVKNCNVATPAVLIKAQATSFGKDITVTLSVGGKADIK